MQSTQCYDNKTCFHKLMTFRFILPTNCNHSDSSSLLGPFITMPMNRLNKATGTNNYVVMCVKESKLKIIVNIGRVVVIESFALFVLVCAIFLFVFQFIHFHKSKFNRLIVKVFLDTFHGKNVNIFYVLEPKIGDHTGLSALKTL